MSGNGCKHMQRSPRKKKDLVRLPKRETLARIQRIALIHFPPRSLPECFNVLKVNGHMKTSVPKFIERYLEGKDNALFFVHIKDEKSVHMFNHLPIHLTCYNATCLYFVDVNPAIARQQFIHGLFFVGVTPMDRVLNDCLLPVMVSSIIRPRTDLFELVIEFTSSIQMAAASKNNMILPMSSESLFRFYDLEEDEMLFVLERYILKWNESLSSLLQQITLTNDLVENICEWENRSIVMDSLFAQLQSSSSRSVLENVDKLKSDLVPSFSKLLRNFYFARLEALEKSKILNILKPFLVNLKTDNIGNVGLNFRPIMHTILLAWKTSQYFCEKPFLVETLKSISNLLQSRLNKDLLDRNYLSSLVLTMDYNRATNLVLGAIKLIGEFKSSFLFYRKRASEECSSNRWDISNKCIFSDVDLLLAECHDLLDVINDCLAYNTLHCLQVPARCPHCLVYDSALRGIQHDFEDVLQELLSFYQNVNPVSINKQQLRKQYYTTFKNRIIHLGEVSSI